MTKNSSLFIALRSEKHELRAGLRQCGKSCSLAFYRRLKPASARLKSCPVTCESPKDLRHTRRSLKNNPLKISQKSRKAARFIERPFGRFYDYALTTAPPSMPLAGETTHTSAHGHTNPSPRNQTTRAEMLFHKLMENKPTERHRSSQI